MQIVDKYFEIFQCEHQPWWPLITKYGAVLFQAFHQLRATRGSQHINSQGMQNIITVYFGHKALEMHTNSINFELFEYILLGLQHLLLN